MKKILLISNKVMHYRSRIYNYFFNRFLSLGYEFHVVSNEYQKVDFPIHYKQHLMPFGISCYISLINELKPDVCINFLHLKDGLIIPLTLYCRLKKIPMIYWNHGINIKTPNAKIKNFIFHFIHTISNAIILYSPAQLKYLSKRNRQKAFIAKNTLDFSHINKSELCAPATIRQIYGIHEKKILLYISRILPYKGLNILLDNFQDTPDIGLVIVGTPLDEKQRKTINSCPNYHYLGEMYGKEVDEIYQMGDFFSTPGHIGLALNQAMFWGKPVIVLNRVHAPEIISLRNGENGYIVNTPKELKEKIMDLCHNDTLLQILSNNARKTYEKEMNIENMFQGFMNAIHFVGK